MIATTYTADCLEHMQTMDDNTVDLVFTSPPYEDARTYGVDFSLTGDAWVEWAADRFVECQRVCSGLVAWVVEGRTRKFKWSATPILLMAELHRRGLNLRKPPAFVRHGIPGSGGPDWLRNDYEFVICSTKGKLSWSDNTACGWPCKYKTGGAMSNRTKDGTRRNAKTGSKVGNNGRPKVTNPGNVLKFNVGRGHMGSDLAHENEAPFPEALAEFFVKSFCVPGGIVLDPFGGSGTTAAAAVKNDRNAMSIDIRETMSQLTRRRLAE